MQADFAAAHTSMAKQTRGEREAFVAAVVDEVNSLMSTFSRDRDNLARKGRDDRGTFLTELRSKVTLILKETADDLMGARLVWRGQSLKKSRPAPIKKEPVVVRPISPPVETSLKKVAAPEIKAVKPPVIFKAPPKEVVKKKVAAPEVEAVKPPVIFRAPPKEDVKKKVAVPEVEAVKLPVIFRAPPKEDVKKEATPSKSPAVEPPNVKIQPPFIFAPKVTKHDEKSEKPTNTAKGKPGKKK
jgi:hypothetical protein